MMKNSYRDLLIFFCFGIVTILVTDVLTCGPPDAVCATCDANDTSCTSCFRRFGLNATTLTCQPCAANCDNCTTIGEKCIQCKGGGSGYAPDEQGGSCSPCSDYMCNGLCSENGPGKCDSCADQYGLNTSFLCAPCGPHCRTCPVSGAGLCDFCLPGYGLDATNRTCVECGSHCISCNTNGYMKCDPDQCELGYILNATLQCELITTTTATTTTTTTITTTTTVTTTTVSTTTPPPPTTQVAVSTAAPLASLTSGDNDGLTKSSGSGSDGGTGTADSGGVTGKNTQDGLGGSSTPGSNGGTGSGQNTQGPDGGSGPSDGGNGGSSTRNPNDGGSTKSTDTNGGNTGDGNNGGTGTGDSQGGSTTKSGEDGGDDDDKEDKKRVTLILGIVLPLLFALSVLTCCWFCCPYFVVRCCPARDSAPGYIIEEAPGSVPYGQYSSYDADHENYHRTKEMLYRPSQRQINYPVGYDIRSPTYFETGLKR